MTLDGNAFLAALDPRNGGKAAVAEACRNLACVGATPMGVTNCLNFGNPEKPEVMWQFKEVIEGMAEACRSFGIPVTGGNVSFYNDTEGASVLPTPVLGVVGLLQDAAKMVTPGFKAGGEVVVLLGRTRPELGGSEYLRTVHGLQEGPCPTLDLAEEIAVQELCREAADKGLLRSAHDVSEGGLAVCLAECAFHGRPRIGCDLDLGEEMRADALLFGESQSRIVVTARPEDLDKLLGLARKKRVHAVILGETGGTELIFHHQDREAVRVQVAEAYSAWKDALPEAFKIK
jgi:phosphoribosylformylglycinamidine synthase